MSSPPLWLPAWAIGTSQKLVLTLCRSCDRPLPTAHTTKYHTRPTREPPKNSDTCLALCVVKGTGHAFLCAAARPDVPPTPSRDAKSSAQPGRTVQPGRHLAAPKSGQNQVRGPLRSPDEVVRW